MHIEFKDLPACFNSRNIADCYLIMPLVDIPVNILYSFYRGANFYINMTYLQWQVAVRLGMIGTVMT
jgi:hypothetical protein